MLIGKRCCGDRNGGRRQKWAKMGKNGQKWARIVGQKLVQPFSAVLWSFSYCEFLLD